MYIVPGHARLLAAVEGLHMRLVNTARLMDDGVVVVLTRPVGNLRENTERKIYQNIGFPLYLFVIV
jgi:hypothetical protein